MNFKQTLRLKRNSSMVLLERKKFFQMNPKFINEKVLRKFVPKHKVALPKPATTLHQISYVIDKEKEPQDKKVIISQIRTLFKNYSDKDILSSKEQKKLSDSTKDFLASYKLLNIKKNQGEINPLTNKPQKHKNFFSETPLLLRDKKSIYYNILEQESSIKKEDCIKFLNKIDYLIDKKAYPMHHQEDNDQPKKYRDHDLRRKVYNERRREINKSKKEILLTTKMLNNFENDNSVAPKEESEENENGPRSASVSGAVDHYANLEEKDSEKGDNCTSMPTSRKIMLRRGVQAHKTNRANRNARILQYHKNLLSTGGFSQNKTNYTSKNQTFGLNSMNISVNSPEKIYEIIKNQEGSAYKSKSVEKQIKEHLKTKEERIADDEANRITLYNMMSTSTFRFGEVNLPGRYRRFFGDEIPQKYKDRINNNSVLAQKIHKTPLLYYKSLIQDYK